MNSAEYTSYKGRVWDYLAKIPRCGVWEVSALCIPENRPFFIRAVQEYIAGHEYGGGISFTDETYTKIRRSALPPLKTPVVL